MQTNRRQYQRIPCAAQPGTIESDGRRADCEIIDESIGGFRIRGINPMTLNHNQSMTIEHRGERIDVVCANAARIKGGIKKGGFAIGVKRIDTMETSCRSNDDADSLIDHTGHRFTRGLRDADFETPHKPLVPEVDGKIINPYIRFGPHAGVLCQIVSVESSLKLTIEILEKKQFTVDPQAVFPMTRDERQSELEAEESIDWLADIYSDCSSQPVAASIPALLEFEFDRVHGSLAT